MNSYRILSRTKFYIYCELLPVVKKLQKMYNFTIKQAKEMKFKTKLTVKNNPGSDNPVFYWFKIPKESRVYPKARRHVLDSTETQP